MDQNQVLKYLIEHDKIDTALVQQEIEMKTRYEYLEKHPYRMWVGKNGFHYTYLPDGEGGRKLVKRKTDEELKNTVIEYWKEQDENPTILELFKEWNDRRLELKKIAPPTHRRNQYIVDKHFSIFGKNHIKSVDADDFADFLEEQIPTYNMTAKAFSNLKTITMGIIRWARRKKLIPYSATEVDGILDVSDKAFRKVIKEDIQEVFDDAEFETVVKYLVGHQDSRNLAILLMFVGGMRVGEVVALQHKDIRGNVVAIRKTETRVPANGKKNIFVVKDYPKSSAGIRDIVIPNDYLWLVEILSNGDPDGYVFLGEKNQRLNTDNIRKRMLSVCGKNGVYYKSPHKIRKTYGTILLDNHVDQNLVIGQMGHADILVTENHYHRNRKDNQKKAEILSAIPDFKGVLYFPTAHG